MRNAASSAALSPVSSATVAADSKSYRLLGHVTEGEFRFGLNDETPSVLAAGQAFYEPPGANHTAGESANPQRAARILAIIIAPVEKK